MISSTEVDIFINEIKDDGIEENNGGDRYEEYNEDMNDDGEEVTMSVSTVVAWQWKRAGASW